MTATRRTIILPVRDNAGHQLTHELAECERELLRIAGGFTAFSARGQWAENGHVYRDRSRVYLVSVDPAADAELTAILPLWRARLRQQALYTDSASTEVTFA